MSSWMAGLNANGGWNCAICHTWIPANTVHQCGGTTPIWMQPSWQQQPSPPLQTGAIEMHLSHIGTCLAQIVEELRKLREEGF